MAEFIWNSVRALGSVFDCFGECVCMYVYHLKYIWTLNATLTFDDIHCTIAIENGRFGTKTKIENVNNISWTLYYYCNFGTMEIWREKNCSSLIWLMTIIGWCPLSMLSPPHNNICAIMWFQPYHPSIHLRSWCVIERRSDTERKKTQTHKRTVYHTLAKITWFFLPVV